MYKLYLLGILFIFLQANEKVFVNGVSIKIPFLNGILNQDKYIKVKSFYIDKYEVSCGEIREFCKKGCPIFMQNLCSIYDTNNTPIYSISYKQAEWICKQKKGRLPTEKEWMVAASVKNNKFYPYGNIDIKKLSFSIEEVNNTLKNINGIYGIFGNVSEIVKSNGKYAIIKGGSFFDVDKQFYFAKNCFYIFDSRISQKVIKKYLSSLNQTGFRCVYDSN